jgi:hypothetical protein
LLLLRPVPCCVLLLRQQSDLEFSAKRVVNLPSFHVDAELSADRIDDFGNGHPLFCGCHCTNSAQGRPGFRQQRL